MNRIKCGVAQSGIALGLMYIIFAFFAWNNGNTSMVVLWVSLAIIFWAESDYILKKWEKEYAQKTIKEPNMLLEFYEDKFIVTKNGFQIQEIEYLQVDDVEEHKDFYILHYNKKENVSSKFTVNFISQKELENSCLIVTKNGFEIGSAKEFIKFIKGKKQKGFIIH